LPLHDNVLTYDLEENN